jgi:hypothetical protein
VEENLEEKIRERLDLARVRAYPEWINSGIPVFAAMKQSTAPVTGEHWGEWIGWAAH